MRDILKYGEYAAAGYNLIPKELFSRYISFATRAVNLYLRKGAISENSENISDENKRGLFEICDLYFREITETNKVSSFSNEGYRESYFQDESLEKRIYNIIKLYFRREQIYRGV